MDRSGTASGSGADETPEQKLQAVVSQLSRAVDGSAIAGSKYDPLGAALVFRPAAHSLHVVGESLLAAEFRRLVTAGAVPAGICTRCRPGAPRCMCSRGRCIACRGSNRFYNLLERAGFVYVEEVAVTPEGCLLELRNSGPRFITAVRRVIAELDFGSAEASTGRLLAPGDVGPATAGPVPPAGLPADAVSWAGPPGQTDSAGWACAGAGRATGRTAS